MQFQVSHSIKQFTQLEWNNIAGTDYPFLRHEFLSALETHDCVGEKYGWIPRFLAIRDANGKLSGAIPLYLKTNSYGEFVFDWSWADAYQRQGLKYYPKAVVAVPYTPVTGSRFLIARHCDQRATALQLIQFAQQFAESEGLSSLHWLFTDDEQTGWLKEKQLSLRLGCQFHWHNHQYANFDAFLSTMTTRKRKKIKRERRHVTEANIEHRIVHGHEANDALLKTMYDFYQTTFEKKSGCPTLTLSFFTEIAQTMGEQLVFIVATKASQAVAGAICFRSQNTLYGRHWGCYEDYHSLHFETCYYQGIEYCIENRLEYFEPGAQGEHKISRGFLPVETWSAHWIADAKFNNAIKHFLSHEQAAMKDYIEELRNRTPYK
jgi:predicted N-acyltransferase